MALKFQRIILKIQKNIRKYYFDNQKSTSYQQYKFYYLSMAAVFIGTLIFYNFPFNKQKLIKLDSNSPIISTVISGEEITDELIIEFYSESIFLNENNLYE